MADRPILFSGPMVRALIEGRKTQTRRVIADGTTGEAPSISPRYAVGDRLWVRETWTARMTHGWTIADARSRMYQEEILYRADGHESIDGWWPSIHMPREFSRITLISTSVRMQRLQEISEVDCIEEGACVISIPGTIGDPLVETPEPHVYATPRKWYRELWDSLNADRGYGWDTNPWVIAVSFDVRRGNIDQVRP